MQKYTWNKKFCEKWTHNWQSFQAYVVLLHNLIRTHGSLRTYQLSYGYAKSVTDATVYPKIVST